ncbi:MAG TPA: hypothetical protein PK513_03835 [Alphaproteobacteria bacterium]|nr:hypothetical protein [Alphaproteobacteria bacterium]USO05474.1 MAG: hypothetical protein H6859_10105 [Rhodospirillales bacterium]HOO81614.1 hypothetical protein [Alphaproteobacteria bacterium]
MRIFVIIAVMILAGMVMASASVYAQDDSVQFFEVLDDVPLMPGLIELPERSMSFDKPGGRVVESVAEMAAMSVDSVRAYYASVLPQFGWNPVGGDQFIRNGERLEMMFEDEAGIIILRLSIQPK